MKTENKTLSFTLVFMYQKLLLVLILSILIFPAVPAKAQSPLDHLTEEEKNWLARHSTIRLGVGIAFPPFMWVESKDGQHQFKGMVSDYINLLSRQLNVDMKIVFNIPFNDALVKGKEKEIDFFPCLSKTPERSQFLLFTEPYLSYPMVIITREDSPIAGGVQDLNGKRLAVVKHLVVYSKLKNDYNDLNLKYVFTKTIDENLEMVALGKADACIINLAAASYFIQKKGYTNLRIASSVNWEGVQLAMGVRNDWPIFHGIIEKSLAAMSQNQKDRISQRWIRAEFKPGVDTGLLWRWSLGIGSGIAILFLLFFIWNQRLQQEIVEKEKAEKALKDNEEKLRNIVENSTNLFYSHTADHQIIYISPQCREFLQCEPEEAMIRWTEFATDNPMNQKGVALTETAIKTGKRQPPYELELMGRKGRKILVEVREAPIVKNGKTIAMVGSLTDITDHKRAEKEKANLQAQLIQAQKMKAIGTLSGGIAHEFNNILGIILGNTELAMEDLSKFHPVHDFLLDVRNASLRGKEVVKQLLNFSRQSTHKKQVLDLMKIVMESIKFLRASIPVDIEFRTDLNENCRPVIGDKTQIHQLIINLCNNAAQAMEDTGGQLEISLKNVTLEEPIVSFDQSLEPGNYVQLVISDTGDGIPEKVLEHVFDPFFTTKPVDKGSGMGLAVVYGIVKSHEGFIKIKSKPGIGTSVFCFFPSTDKTPLDTESQTTITLPTGTETILFIDDEQSIVDIGAQQLERLGYTVVTFTDPIKALECFKADPQAYDLAITDMTMPQMTGDQLIKELISISTKVKTILCTGYSKKLNDEKAFRIGATAYLMKPIDKEMLAITVRKILDMH